MSVGEERSTSSVTTLGKLDRAEFQPGEMAGRVLIVDDHDSVLTSLKEMLGANGFAVTTARNPAQAIHALETEQPDIIVCDVVMPGLDGFQLHEQIRSKPEWNSIPFIFLSALTTQEDMRYAKALGCDDYLVKPFEPIDLISVLKGKLRTCRRRKRASEEQLERYRRRIVNTLSHEFRTPLVAINTGTEILLDQIESIEPPNARKLLESIQRGGMRLQRLVEDFMTLQQIDSGAAADAAARNQRRVSIVLLAETAIETFLELTKDGVPQIRLSVPENSNGGPFVHVHEIQIINALQRVLSNAYKFSGKSQTIEVSVRTSPEYASVCIRDYGPGLPIQQVMAACGLFEQIDRDRQEQQGCGLGLTIARYFTELNGGDIYFRQPLDGVGLEVEVAFFRTP